MRVFIAVLVLIFSLQSWTKADDIRDFEIEGMSIGDSALKYFTKEELNSSKSYHWPNKKFVSSGGWLKNSDSYEAWQIFYKDKDEKYIIHYLSGLTGIENLETCNKKKNEVVNDIKSSINEAEFIDLGKAKPYPCYMYGYGSYGVIDDPTFDKYGMSLVNRGYLYCTPQLRGSKFYGPQWYKDGKYLQKKNTFHDFQTAAKYLISNKYHYFSVSVLRY